MEKLLRGTGAAIYVIDGRVLIRTIDNADGLALPRGNSAATLDGFPHLDATRLGDAVVNAVADADRLERPQTLPKMSDYNNTLLAETEETYKSFRTWQRAARHVNAAVHADRWEIARLHPDLKGGWAPARPSDPAHHDFPQRFDLQLYAEPEEIGDVVLQLLAQPSLRESIGH